MNTKTIHHTMLNLLTQYRNLIHQQLSHHALVGEYLTLAPQENTRLLCQTRTILFLLKTAELLDASQIALAEQLYSATEQQYIKDNCWLQTANGEQEANLYSYAFVLLAQSSLYKATKNPLYSIALAETFSHIEHQLTDNRVFQPLTATECLEQNSAMHLYEALSFAYYQADAIYIKPTLSALKNLIKQTFWQNNKLLLAEKVTLQGKVLTYEAGHWFEWVSLTWKVNQWSQQPAVIDPVYSYESAIKHACFNKQGFLLNEMDVQLTALESQQIRIWPNLEYIRATVFLTHNPSLNEHIGNVLNHFFDNRGLPIEYIGRQGEQPVKSTTGYHIAESFVDILGVINATY